jgi:uncharacterized protein (TIGR02145 family)
MKEKRSVCTSLILLTGMLMTLAISCKNESIPVLTTTEVIYITQITATCGGIITIGGDATITARGFCWGTNPAPSITDNITTDITGTYSFTGIVTGLTANTTYYERAYATNSAGTGYGNVVSFTTPGIVTDIDGVSYNTVVIGTQLWMAENLKTTSYRNGDPIQNISDSLQWVGLTIGAYCNYRNSFSNENTYGHLYNWYAVNDSRKIAPVGWHIPTEAEWTTLTTFLGEDAAGDKLKEAGHTHWGSNNDANNETGFTALPGGFRTSNDGSFDQITHCLYFWSSDPLDASRAWCRVMYWSDESISGYTMPKQFGFSLRCIKD